MRELVVTLLITIIFVQAIEVVTPKSLVERLASRKDTEKESFLVAQERKDLQSRGTPNTNCI